MASANDWITHEHPLYAAWKDRWALLGEAYEGDGGFQDGSHLVAHPRELNYARTADNQLTSEVIGEKTKFARRKAIARYENFAATIIETLVAYQYAKSISRVVGDASDPVRDTQHPLELWWQDVDGQGTHIDDYLEAQQVIADIYGYVVILMDLPKQDAPAVTKADQPAPFLRSYTPLDMPDWLMDRTRLTAVKLTEAVEREALEDDDPEAADAIQYRTWSAGEWALYDADGNRLDGKPHSFGECPVVVLRARKRTKAPAFGSSVLGDPMQYVDHYNLISEGRELLRNQVFSMLNIPLGPDETVVEGSQRLGDHAGTDSLLWTKGGMASFVAPPDGPSDRYEREILNLCRSIFRQIGLPWEGDSRDAESADSRRIKAMALNRLLSKLADEAERADYGIARLWFLATHGAERGQTEFEQAGVTIKHPDEFNTDEALAVIEEAKEALTLGLGKRANQLIRLRAVPKLLADLPAEDAQVIKQEIEAAAERTGPPAPQLTERERLTAEVEREAAGDDGRTAPLAADQAPEQEAA